MEQTVVLLLAGTGLGALSSISGGWVLQRQQELKRVRYDLYLLITKARAYNGTLPTDAAAHVARAAIVLPRRERRAAARVLVLNDNARVFRDYLVSLTKLTNPATEEVELAKETYEREVSKAAMETWQLVGRLQKKLGVKSTKQPPLA